MNRTIKFRGHGGTKWLVGYFTTYDGACYIKAIDRDQRFGCGIDVDPDSVGQFTGLKDRDGVEIYEGDVLHLGCCNFERNVRAVVTWDDNRPTMRTDIINEPREGQYEGRPVDTLTQHSWAGSHCCLSGHIAHKHEVIGNIYENPELLEV